jgi:hypothetical protein
VDYAEINNLDLDLAAHRAGLGISVRPYANFPAWTVDTSRPPLEGVRLELYVAARQTEAIAFFRLGHGSSETEKKPSRAPCTYLHSTTYSLTSTR